MQTCMLATNISVSGLQFVIGVSCVSTAVAVTIADSAGQLATKLEDVGLHRVSKAHERTRVIARLITHVSSNPLVS